MSKLYLFCYHDPPYCSLDFPTAAESPHILTQPNPFHADSGVQSRATPRQTHRANNHGQGETSALQPLPTRHELGGGLLPRPGTRPCSTITLLQISISSREEIAPCGGLRLHVHDLRFVPRVGGLDGANCGENHEWFQGGVARELVAEEVG